ncbi:MAG: hypothetical protein ABI577_15590 [bacterium]
MDTRPISAVLAIASYQIPIAHDYTSATDANAYLPRQAPDTVEISSEARGQAQAAAEAIHLWGEVRYDPPHTDDPDLPWEAAHQEWVDLMRKVLGEQPEG